ncbi:MAG: YdcF family protein, partial [Actinobacteria bacterium]|nr:YdcF family protein [Actinomycetota bacterium]
MRLFRVVLVIVLLVAWYPTWLAFRIWSQSRQDEVRSADVIVVLGAAQYDGNPSPVFKARLDQAAYLYEEDLSDTVIVTGGKRPGDRYTEAHVAEDYLVNEHGISEGAILQEQEGSTTFESLKQVREIARAENLDSALLVSDPMHSERIKRMALDLGFEEAYASWASYERLQRSRETKARELLHEVTALLVYELFNR